MGKEVHALTLDISCQKEGISAPTGRPGLWTSSPEKASCPPALGWDTRYQPRVPPLTWSPIQALSGNADCLERSPLLPSGQIDRSAQPSLPPGGRGISSTSRTFCSPRRAGWEPACPTSSLALARSLHSGPPWPPAAPSGLAVGCRLALRPLQRGRPSPHCMPLSQAQGSKGFNVRSSRGGTRGSRAGRRERAQSETPTGNGWDRISSRRPERRDTRPVASRPRHVR